MASTASALRFSLADPRVSAFANGVEMMPQSCLADKSPSRILPGNEGVMRDGPQFLPVFSDIFVVERQRLLKDAHLKLTLRRDASRFEAICFNHAESAPPRIRAAYRLAVNEFKGMASVQLVLEHIGPA